MLQQQQQQQSAPDNTSSAAGAPPPAQSYRSRPAKHGGSFDPNQYLNSSRDQSSQDGHPEVPTKSYHYDQYQPQQPPTMPKMSTQPYSSGSSMSQQQMPYGSGSGYAQRVRQALRDAMPFGGYICCRFHANTVVAGSSNSPRTRRHHSCRKMDSW